MTRLLSVLLVLAAGAPALAAQDRPLELEGLVVTAGPTPRPVGAVATHVTVLEGDDLRAAGMTQVAEALRFVPGMTVVGNGSFGSTTSAFLRGGESNHTLVLLDGVQVNQPGGSFDFAGLTLENVERIEVVRGGASALFGSDAVSGVINIITRTGRGAPRGSLEVRGGTYGRLDASIGMSGGGERAGYSISLSRNTTDGILPFNNRFTNTVLSGTARLAPDDATRAALILRVGDRRYHFPTDGSGNVVDRNAFTFGDETTVGVRISRALSSTVTLDVLLGHNEADGGTDDAQDGPADTLGFFGFTSLDHVRRSSAEARANVTLGKAVATVGGEVEEQRQRSFTESVSEFGSFSGRSEYQRWNRAVYVHASSAEGRAGYNAGVRLEDNERFGSSVTWQAGASVAVIRGVRLRASASRAIKEPTFFENYATGFAVGNPDLDPERSVHWEAGGDMDLVGGAATLRATWFHQAFRDLIQYTGAPPRPTDPNFFNVAAANASGLEAGLDVRVHGVGARASWTWLDTEVVDPGVDDGPGGEFEAGESLLRRPAHILSLQVDGRPLPALVTSAGVRWVGTRFDRDFSTFPATRVALARYADAHVAAEVTVGRGVSLLMRVDNLLDEAYSEVVGFRAPGRAVQVGARMALGGR